MKKCIGVVGNGFVGHAMTGLRPNVEVLIWDNDPDKIEPSDLTFEDFVYRSAVIFVAVPTPMRADGSCDLRIVESVVTQIREESPNQHIVFRSTVLPGTSERLGVSFMPEFLTERNWEEDFKKCSPWIIGTHCDEIDATLSEVFSDAHAEGLGSIDSDVLVRTTPTEAELIKYVRNCFLSVKVSFFNEIRCLCDSLNLDYDVVRDLASVDSRIGSSHTQVPGPDGKRGYGGTCFPKDTNALSKFMEGIDVKSPVLDSAILRNETIDRKGKDWYDDKGRAVSD